MFRTFLLAAGLAAAGLASIPVTARVDLSCVTGTACIYVPAVSSCITDEECEALYGPEADLDSDLPMAQLHD